MSDPLDNFHSGQGRRHRLFTDAADRLGDDTQYVSQDVGSFAIQLDNGQAFYLKSINPTLWASVGSGGGGALTPVLDPVGVSGTYNANAEELVIFEANLSGGGPTVNLPVAPVAKTRVGVLSSNTSGMTSVSVFAGGADTIWQPAVTSDQVTQATPSTGVTPLGGKIYQYVAAVQRWFIISNIIAP